MASTTKSIDVNVPVSTAYNQWTQFESFPQFMEGVEEVRQLDHTRLHWRATIGGKTESGRRRSPSSTPITGLLGPARVATTMRVS